MSQHEDQMSDALRRLNVIAPHGASPALGDKLKDEFRRHHAGLKRKRNTRISLLVAGLSACLALLFAVLQPRPSNTPIKHENPKVMQPSAPASAGLIEPEVLPPTVEKARVPVSKIRKNPPTSGDHFVALPTFDPAIPIDHLEMVRLDLPGRALRLVGYPVSEEIAERRVMADVLLTQDGTPYALRLIQSSQIKEQ